MLYLVFSRTIDTLVTRKIKRKNPKSKAVKKDGICIENASKICEHLDKNFPGLVLAVVGDSDSFVPRPWNTTAFTSGLRKTLKGAKSE